MAWRLCRREVLAAAGGLLAGSTAGCGGILAGSGPDVRVPDRTPVGVPFPIRVSGVADVDSVVVSATDGRGRAFERTLDVTDFEDGAPIPAEAFHDGDPSSFVERSPTSSSTVVSGGLDGEGPPRMPLQPLRPVDDGTPNAFVGNDRGGDLVAEHEVTVEASGGGDVVASGACLRVNVAPDIEERRVPADDLVGRIALPDSDGPLPGVVVLHGSAANDLYAWSRRLATHGYAVLTLKYFDAYGLPETLDAIPLEYFDRAVEWFGARSAVDGDRIGFVGISRGVEAALLTAVNYDGSTAVVGYGGSGIASFGIDRLGGSPEEGLVDPAGWEAAWTRDGEPVATAEEVEYAIRNPSPDDPEALGGAGIPVEDVEGPVLLHAGRDDRLWPAVAYSEYANNRLDHFGVSYPHALYVYEGAGHAFHTPYGYYEDPRTNDDLGGTPSTNARAAADSWVRTLEYLEAGLKEE